ncbi:MULTISPECIES: site-specific DNA-methyltransferase [Acinetobacter]|uniref:site-specific DNA-methyltransferase n=1 Tax=Acinetobacter TaxID=469 RepID=UPI001A8CEECB|nr:MULTISPECIES: site-specific DNA-methyltransferase [Acinetobacter]MDM1737485.1 site-specific DNA-methyltransferase [Acinetobacter towneri]QSQ95675.1 site-specific DNA-methyltransferase [Acinetobacter indicus]
MPLLDWVNRNQAEETATSVPYHLLKFEQAYGDEEQAKENLIIQGDNLQALKALLPLYGGQVKCIFIDPPYNTQSAFEHYDDKLEHAQWLSMMYPRLQLLKELLAEDGSIWITLDDNEAHYLKVLADEVFGRKNFLANLIWQKAYSAKMDAQGFSASHDHILVYGKTNKVEIKRLEFEQNSSQFNCFDEIKNKFYRRRSLRKEGSESLRQDRPSMWYPIIAPDGSEIYPIKPTGVEGRWRWKQENVLLNSDDLEFIFKNNKWEIYVKQYAEDKAYRPPETIWLNEDVGHNHEAKLEVSIFNSSDIFETPKPERLIQKILTIVTEENDLILDSFLGSGTTSAVAHKMGRRYIGIEMGEHAKTHVIPRLEKVIEGEQGGISSTVNWQGGGGFSFYTLGNPVFDDQGFLNADVKFKDLASYVWWLETKTALNQTESFDNPYLGTHDGVAYYLLYNGILGDRRPNGGNVLTLSVLNYLNECHTYEGKRVVIGEASRLGDARLEALDIEFKQIPYSLYGNQAQ